MSAAVDLGRDVAAGMRAAKILPGLRRAFLPTMRRVIDRGRADSPGKGWIDMKFDPLDGSERSMALECYRKDRVYGWIQGRGLESMAGHLEWLDGMRGYELLDKAELLRQAEALYARLKAACLGPKGVEASFVMDIEGRPMDPVASEGRATLTQLFSLRGLAAFARYRGYAEDLGKILPALRDVVDLSLGGLCIDDQIAFGSSGGENQEAGRLGFEGQMISIGACEILYRSSSAAEDLERGYKALDSILSRYSWRSREGGPIIVDGLSPEGRPYRKDGHLPANPGHAMEVVGLGLQFIRRASELGLHADRVEARMDLVPRLAELGFHLAEAGRAPHGGIVRSLDAETREVLSGNCPWWSSYESIRTFAEILHFSKDDAERERSLELVESFLSCALETYVGPSSIGVPVQTVDYSGAVVHFIPATPDIDPCYHTGLPLLDAYEILGRRATMLAGVSESRLPPRLGVRLQGHITRVQPADREMDTLHVRSCWIASPAEQTLLISADVIEYSSEWTERVTRRISRELGIPESRVLLLATHTHTAPVTIRLGLVGQDDAFLDLLEGTMVATARQARSSLGPAVAAFGSTRVEGVGINRRWRDPVSGTVSMRPNPAGEVDDELSCLFLFGEGGGLEGVLVNMALHPTTLGTDIHEISADYPGRLARRLREALGSSVVVLPLQGACGDVRPRVLDAEGRDFREGDESDIDRIGSAMAEGVLSCLSALRAGEPGWIDGRDLRAEARDVELPFYSLPDFESVDRLETEMRKLLEAPEAKAPGADFASRHDSVCMVAPSYLEWARRLKAEGFDPAREYRGPRSAKARLACVSLGAALKLFFIPGEAFCRIGKRLKELARPAGAMVCGYCGGSVGYLPTADSIREGGYEVEAAFRFYGFPGPFGAEAESSLYEVMTSMLS